MDPTLTALADANLIESVRQHARWQQPCEWVETDGLLMMAGVNAAPIAYRNCAIRVDPAVPAPEALSRAQAYFGERSRHFTFFVRDSRDSDLISVLEKAGCEQRSESPCMLIDEPIQVPSEAADIEIRGFDDVEQVRDAVTVNAEAYQRLGLAPEELRRYFSCPEGLISDSIIGFVAYRDNKPLATALAIRSGEGAGLYWVGTVDQARGQGLGTYCTGLATDAAFAHGARVVTLQASPYGEPLYRKMGYRPYDTLRWFR